MTYRHIEHAPQPGPMYWDWRCLVCEQPVSEHLTWIERLKFRWHRP